MFGKFKYTLLIPACLFLFGHLNGQRNAQTKDTSTSTITAINADKTRVVKTGQETRYLYGNVIFRQDSIVFYADTAILKDKYAEAFSNITIQIGDSGQVFSNYLDYNGGTRIAILKKQVVLVSKKHQIFTDVLMYDMRRGLTTYKNGALITDRISYLSSKKGVFNTKTGLAFCEDSVVVYHPDFSLTTDSMYFDREKNTTIFVAPTNILVDSLKIYCEGGFYNMNTGLALFTGNAKITDNQSITTGDSIRYDDQRKLLTILGKARHREPDISASAHQMDYYFDTRIVNLEGEAVVVTESQTASADWISYNLDQKIYQTEGNTIIQEGSQTLKADRISKTSTDKWSILEGNIKLEDTASGFSLFCMKAIADDSSAYLKAFGDSTFIIASLNADSLFMSADTFERVESSDSLHSNTLSGYYNVRIYNGEIQGKCDSLIYKEKDSLFTLMGNPILWSDTSQFKADTILIYLRRGSIHRIELKGNGLILNSPDEVFYNQVAGSEIYAYYKSGEINRVYVYGNAQSVYYVQDDDGAYIGVNKVDCSKMWMYFKANRVTGVDFFNEPSGIFHPMNKIDHNLVKLAGFKWFGEFRPMQISDLFFSR